MMKYILLIITIVVTIFTVVGIGGKRQTGISGGTSTVQSPHDSSPSATTGVVPLPTGEDTIRTFIQLINDHNIPEAVGMMDKTIISSDSEKQQYGVVFNSFSTMTLSSITVENFGKDQGTDVPGEERYRVDFVLALKPDSQGGMWEEGKNTRWITIKKQADSGRFMIHDIATGP